MVEAEHKHRSERLLDRFLLKTEIEQSRELIQKLKKLQSTGQYKEN
jgi:hypothetical protein